VWSCKVVRGGKEAKGDSIVRECKSGVEGWRERAMSVSEARRGR